MTDARVPTRQVLHLNLNTKDIGPAADLYVDAFGLDLRMKSRDDNGDWRFHGLADPVDSAGWFLYDDRGPRASPAIELVEWFRPPTAGTSYSTLPHLGMVSLGLSVPALAESVRVVVTAGGQVVEESPSGAEEPRALLRDRDGVFLEVRENGTGASSRIDYARIGVSDLDRSVAFFVLLGFQPTGQPADEVQVHGHRARVAVVGLPGATVELVLTQWLEAAPVEPPHAELWTQGMVRMAVSVDDLDDAVAALRARGVDVPDVHVFALPGTTIGSLPVLFLTDPDGLTVELVHRPPRHFAGETRAAGQVPA